MNHSLASAPGTAAAFDQAVKLATQGNGRNPILKREELKVEELVLKRCWLARYWGLAAKLGVYPNIAHKKHAVWAGVAPLPLEVVIAAGQQVKALPTEHPHISSAKSNKCATDESPNRALPASDKISEEEMPLISKGDGSGIDSQLVVVEEGLRELAELKVEEAVLLKISQNQNPTLIWLGLSREQAQDIQFKQAWLVYYWKRAQMSGVVEVDVAGERLLYWMKQTHKPPSYQDAVNVQRGLFELRSLGMDSHCRLNGHACQESLHNNLHQNLSGENVENFHEETKQDDMLFDGRQLYCT